MSGNLVCAYCGNDMIESYVSCCGEVHFVPLETCPECESEDIDEAHGFTSCGVETNYKVCGNCNHQWSHQ